MGAAPVAAPIPPRASRRTPRTRPGSRTAGRSATPDRRTPRASSGRRAGSPARARTAVAGQLAAVRVEEVSDAPAEGRDRDDDRHRDAGEDQGVLGKCLPGLVFERPAAHPVEPSGAFGGRHFRFVRRFCAAQAFQRPRSARMPL